MAQLLEAQLLDALDVASTAAETLSGDFLGALGAGFMSGAGEAGLGFGVWGEKRGGFKELTHGFTGR